MRLELTHRFATPRRNGFDYIAERRNCPEYWPGLIRVQPGIAPADAGGPCSRHDAAAWGRIVELEMTLRTFDPYRRRCRSFPDQVVGEMT